MVEQLVHAFLPGTRDGLVGRDDDALDLELVVQRLQRDDHLDGGAVRIGDDVALPEVAQSFRVHLRHHQRNVRLHTKMAGVVDHDAAGLGRARGMDGGHSSAGAEQADVTAGEVERVQVADGEDLFLAKGDFRTRRTAGREGDHFRRREIALRQGFDDLASDCPCGAYNRDPVSHDILLSCAASRAWTRTVSGLGEKRQAIRKFLFWTGRPRRPAYGGRRGACRGVIAALVPAAPARERSVDTLGIQVRPVTLVAALNVGNQPVL